MSQFHCKMPCPSLCYIAMVCEKFVNFERIFLYEPCLSVSGHYIAECAEQHNVLHWCFFCLFFVQAKHSDPVMASCCKLCPAAFLFSSSCNRSWVPDQMTWACLIPLFFQCCLMPSDVGWCIRDKLRPMREHGSVLLYVHWNHKAH